MSPHTNLEHASALTYTSAAATVTIWGLHLSDVAIIVSACATLIGVACQVWVSVTRVRMMKRSERRHLGDK